MTESLEQKINALFWDLAPGKKIELLHKIHLDPAAALKDETITLRLLETLNWYELIQLIGVENLYKILDDNNINRLFPPSRRIYYSNAKRLLSKYIISPAG